VGILVYFLFLQEQIKGIIIIGPLLDPEREVLHDVEHVVQVLHRDVLEHGKRESVV
jgi:hypothetical protein